jgi:hypothetical protein
MGQCEWVDEVMIGDGFSEVRYFTLLFLPVIDENSGLDLCGYVLTRPRPRIPQPLKYYSWRLKCRYNPFRLRHHARYAAGPSKKKVYRYTTTMRNPFPGSAFHQIPGHHFIDILFLFQTLRERYPSERLRDLSEEFGKRWIRFAIWEKP